MDDRRLLPRLLAAKTTDDLIAAAARYGLLREGLIDLSRRRVRFDHRDLDLSRFRLEDADLSGSVLVNPQGDGASFRGCVLRNVKVRAEPGKRASLRNASFDGARIEDSELGPRTLDLSGSSFRDARLVRVVFRLGQLTQACFDRARLVESMLRGATLEGASFREAVLEATSLERAVLRGADFSGAEFRGMEKWGEPDFSGALIADDLRYRFGIVRDPVVRLQAVLNDGTWSDTEKRSLETLLQRVRAFAAEAPEAMLIEDEYGDIVPAELFRRALKAAKQGN